MGKLNEKDILSSQDFYRDHKSPGKEFYCPFICCPLQYNVELCLHFFPPSSKGVILSEAGMSHGITDMETVHKLYGHD